VVEGKSGEAAFSLYHLNSLKTHPDTEAEEL
jgi:hypothetical protein